MVRFTMCWCFIFSGHGGWSYKSILVGRIDIRPERVVVVSGLSKIFFSLVLNRHSFLISKQLLIYSQNVLPTSRSPFRQDMSVLKFSFVGSCGISVKLFSWSNINFLSVSYSVHSNTKWNSDSILLQWKHWYGKHSAYH